MIAPTIASEVPTILRAIHPVSAIAVPTVYSAVRLRVRPYRLVFSRQVSVILIALSCVPERDPARSGAMVVFLY